jgi:hypothetical protein
MRSAPALISSDPIGPGLTLGWSYSRRVGSPNGESERALVGLRTEPPVTVAL